MISLSDHSGETRRAPGSSLSGQYRFVHEHPQEFVTSGVLNKFGRKVHKFAKEIHEVKAQGNEFGATGIEMKQQESTSYASFFPNGVLFTLAMLIAFDTALKSLIGAYGVRDLQIVILKYELKQRY